MRSAGSSEQLANVELWQGDCLELLKEVEDCSIDLVLCDLPYGITSIKWDCTLPIQQLWAEWHRVCKPSAAVVLTAQQPFTSILITSNLKEFKYTWVWNKVQAGMRLLAKIQPLRVTEDVVVFYSSQPVYNRQMRTGFSAIKRTGGKTNTQSEHGGIKCMVDNDSSTERVPINLVTFSHGYSPHHKAVHPTQKPVALMEYMIRTYTNEGERVLDNCMGSGTTAVACINTGRRFLGVELDEKYYDIAVERVRNAIQAKGN